MYETLPPSSPLSQGDVLDGCSLLGIDPATIDRPGGYEVNRWSSRVVILTQACDLAQARSSRVLVAVVHDARVLVEEGILKAATIRDQVRRGQVFGWYFLPAAPHPIDLPESIVDLRDLHTIHRSVLEYLAGQGRRVCRIITPYREHLAQHFAVTYSRIGLPEPYESEP